MMLSEGAGAFMELPPLSRSDIYGAAARATARKSGCSCSGIWVRRPATFVSAAGGGSDYRRNYEQRTHAEGALLSAQPCSYLAVAWLPDGRVMCAKGFGTGQ